MGMYNPRIASRKAAPYRTVGTSRQERGISNLSSNDPNFR